MQSTSHMQCSLEPPSPQRFDALHSSLYRVTPGGEVTVPSYDNERQNTWIVTRGHPCSKSGSNRTKLTLSGRGWTYTAAAGAAICPVHALWSYLLKRGPDPGPLFVFNSGAPLTRTELVDDLHQALQQLAFKSKLYNGHNFRIGASTAGIERTPLGRWKSTAYLAYIQIPSNSWPPSLHNC